MAAFMGAHDIAFRFDEFNEKSATVNHFIGFRVL
jgi:hypothetical protein